MLQISAEYCFKTTILWYSFWEPIDTVMRMRLEVEITHSHFRLFPPMKSGLWFPSHDVDLKNRKDGKLVFAAEP